MVSLRIPCCCCYCCWSQQLLWSLLALLFKEEFRVTTEVGNQTKGSKYVCGEYQNISCCCIFVSSRRRSQTGKKQLNKELFCFMHDLLTSFWRSYRNWRRTTEISIKEPLRIWNCNCKVIISGDIKQSTWGSSTKTIILSAEVLSK